MGITICTIAARNYLHYVRTLANSLLEVHPRGTVVALVVDDNEMAVGAEEPFEVLRLTDLRPDLDELHRMALIYDVTEFSTALKPWLLETLLDRGHDPILYLDPDIQVFSSLQPLAEAASRNGIALTPHAETPLPLDGKMADDRLVLAAGVYNLGFLGVSAAARPFLEYWKARLRRDCVNDPRNMRFVDQRWVDFVPGMFEHVIIRDPQYNVAYWNLHGRTLCWNGEGYEVNGRPLAFFHFSGYSTQAPHLLSKHQGDRPRILLSEQPDLSRLCDEYRAQLVANGADITSKIEYGFSRMADGTPLDPVVRHLLRRWILEAEADGKTPRVYPPDPFDAGQVNALIDRLRQAPDREDDPGRLSNYLATIHALREDLQEEFPFPQHRDHAHFMEWAADAARRGEIPTVFAGEPMEPSRREASSAASMPLVRSACTEWLPRHRLRPGVVVAGYLRAELGVGEGARLSALALKESGVPFTTIGYSATPSRQEHPFTVLGEPARDFDTTLVVVNADQFARFVAEAGQQFFDGRYTVAQWAWELETFPKSMWPAFNFVDEIWAVSQFTRDAIAAVTEKPVYAFPHPIVEPQVGELDRAELGIPGGPLFLFSFDMFSVVERKNPIGLVNAFCEAFRPGEGPTLVLKVSNGDRRVAELEKVKWAARQRRDIVFVDRYLRHDENAALVAESDCYVSLHRSEGFGLAMGEAMALGKPVIATAYSGNMDFMTESTAYLVPYSTTRVPAGCDPYPAGVAWAEPDLEAAARLMRRTFDNPEEGRVLGSRARTHVLEHHGLANRAAFIRSRFGDIQLFRASLIESPNGARRQLLSPTVLRRAASQRVRAVKGRLAPVHTPSNAGGVRGVGSEPT